MSLPRFLPSFGAVADHGAPSRLGAREQADVSDAVLEIAPDWCVELCGVTLEDRSLIVMPEDGDDMTGPTFIIRNAGAAVVLEEMRWDECHPVAASDDLPGVIRDLRTRLRIAARQVPASRLRH